jgi:hypothetical protein
LRKLRTFWSSFCSLARGWRSARRRSGQLLQKCDGGSRYERLY